jgi:hypothetical protein
MLEHQQSGLFSKKFDRPAFAIYVSKERRAECSEDDKVTALDPWA